MNCIKPKRQPAPKTAVRSLEGLLPDVLWIVLVELWDAGGYEDLITLCLVSRQLYIFTVPKLYRNVLLDFSRTSHFRLLRRLAQPGSHLPGMIRILTISNISKDSPPPPEELLALSSALTHLHLFSWDDYYNSPAFMLAALDSRFSRNRSIVRGRYAELGALMTAPLPFQHALTHSAGSLLTVFDFRPSTVDQLYFELKNDLITMLIQNRALKKVSMYPEAWFSKEYPDMLWRIRGHSLPKLEKFEMLLECEIFTVRELNFWAGQGGWEELTHLAVRHTHHLPCFIGKMPNLAVLMASPLLQNDPYSFGDYVDDANFKAPFGPLRRLWFQGFTGTRDLPHQNSRIIPWNLLRRLPNLTELVISRTRFDGATKGSNIDTPSAQDIRNIRKLCPNLTMIDMDISLTNEWAPWPKDVLTELAKFEHLLQPKLYLHRHNTTWAEIKLRSDVLRMTRFICRERRSRGRPYRMPFNIFFKVVRPWKEMKRHHDSADYTTFYDETSGTLLYSQIILTEVLDTLTLEELEQKRSEQVFRKIGMDFKGYEEEIKRRQKVSTDDSTLFDTLV